MIADKRKQSQANETNTHTQHRSINIKKDTPVNIFNKYQSDVKRPLEVIALETNHPSCGHWKTVTRWPLDNSHRWPLENSHLMTSLILWPLETNHLVMTTISLSKSGRPLSRSSHLWPLKLDPLQLEPAPLAFAGNYCG